MIHFRKMVVQNFMSFGKAQEIPLHNEGVVLVEGRNLDETGNDSNGSGKSAIIEALLWCLFNKTLRGLRHDKIVNRFAKRDCFVGVYFRVHKSEYIVQRYRRHKRYANRLRLCVDGHSMAFRHEEDAQARLEEILSCDYIAFSNAVLFGGGRPFASLSDSEQKRVLESFLRFDQVDRALSRTKEYVSATEERLHGLDVECERARGDVLACRTRLRTLREAEADQREKASEEVEKAKAKLKALPVLRGSVESAESELDHRQSKLSKCEAKIDQLEEKLAEIRKVIEDKSFRIGARCPVCDRKIDLETVTKYVSHLISERDKVRSELSEAKGRLSKLERRFKHAREYLKRVQDITHREEEAKGRVLKALTLASSASSLDPDIAESSIKYSKAVSRQLVLEQEKLLLKRALEDLRFWKGGFGNRGIKALIVKEALPTMNSKLEEYAEEMFSGKAEIKFKPTKASKTGSERELFHINYSAKRGSSSYAGESSGRKRRVDICVLLVFAWLSRTSNILLVDELLDSLDATGRESVLGVLTRLRGTVLVITHRSDVRSRLGHIWTVVKHRGFSRIEYVA